MLQKIKWIDFCIVLINFNIFFYMGAIWYLCLANISVYLPSVASENTLIFSMCDIMWLIIASSEMRLLLH